jgi:hypothetical protein
VEALEADCVRLQRELQLKTQSEVQYARRGVLQVRTWLAGPHVCRPACPRDGHQSNGEQGTGRGRQTDASSAPRDCSGKETPAHKSDAAWAHLHVRARSPAAPWQVRDIQASQAKASSLEQSMEQLVVDFDAERRRLAEAARAALADAESERDALRQALRLRTRELKTVRLLSREVLAQRSDVEAFLVSSIQMVRGKCCCSGWC